MQPVQNYSRSIVTAPNKVRPVPMQKTDVAAAALLLPSIESNASQVPSTYTLGQPVKERPISEQLFVALADVKVWTSKVAMHLDRNTRDRLFKQLDVLHDVEEWAEGDKPINLLSYKSLVRAIIYHEVNSRPSLALMPTGNLLAMWRDGEDKLTIEFQPKDRVRWLVHNNTPDGPERSTGSSPLQRLRDVLQPYSAARWFDGS